MDLTDTSALVLFLLDAANTDNACAEVAAVFTGDINAVEFDSGITPLIACIVGRRPQTLRVLATRGDVDVNYKKWSGWNALFAAVVRVDGLTSLLLELFPDVKVDDCRFRGNTPLGIAASYGIEANVEALLEHGADPTIENEHGALPEELAHDAGHVHVADLIARHVVWRLSLRSDWLRAVLNPGGSTGSPPSSLLECMLADTDRVVFPRDGDASSYQTGSEFALMVTFFL